MPLFEWGDKFADQLCAHLLKLGVQVELLNEHQLKQVAATKATKCEPGKIALGLLLDVLSAGWLGWLVESGGSGGEEDYSRGKSLGLIQVSGKNIDYINVISASSGSGSATKRDYYLEYLVLLENIPPNSCWAELETEKRRGLFRRKVADIEWTGGILADKLNGDLTLKNNLLKEFHFNRPLDIKVIEEPTYRCARIETGERGLFGKRPWDVFDTIDRVQESEKRRSIPLPSRNLFDCIDRIAGLTAEHVSEVNS